MRRARGQVGLFLSLGFLLLLAAPLCVDGLAWAIDAGDERCVEQSFQVGKTAHMFFEVIQGTQDLEVTVFSPHKEQLYHSQDESEGSYSFVTKEAGRFRFCFSNNKATSSDKVVSFEVASGTELKDVAAHPDHFTPLEHGVLQLSEALRSAREDSSYMYFRESHHRDLTEATYERLRYVAALEAVALVLMSVAQIWYLRRFFERKRVV